MVKLLPEGVDQLVFVKDYLLVSIKHPILDVLQVTLNYELHVFLREVQSCSSL